MFPNILTRLEEFNTTPVDKMDRPYTNVKINTLGGTPILSGESFASGKELLLKVAQSMIDPACVIRLLADEHVVNKAILHNEA